MSDAYTWAPLSLSQVESLFSSFPGHWWICGGLAIDAFLGYASRPHEDIDVGILRRDQLKLQELLQGWDLRVPDPPREGVLRPWRSGEYLEGRLHNLWCRPDSDTGWAIEVLLNESVDDDWLYRRDLRVRRPIREIVWQHGGLPYLAAEVQLLFKAAAPGINKNQADFDACLPRLDGRQRHWLAGALATAHPGHFWLSLLSHAETSE